MIAARPHACFRLLRRWILGSAVASAFACGAPPHGQNEPSAYAVTASWAALEEGARVEAPRQVTVSYFERESGQPVGSVRIDSASTRMSCCGSDGKCEPSYTDGAAPHQVRIGGLRAPQAGKWMLLLEATVDGQHYDSQRLTFEAR